MDTTQPNAGFYPAVKNLAIGSWNSTEGSRLRFFAFVVLFILAYSLDLMVPWAMGYTLGVVVKEGITDAAFNNALLGIGAYVGLQLAKTLCHHVARYLQQTVAFHARMKTLEDIFSTLLGFPLSWHVSHHSGESLSRLHRSAGAIDSTVGTYIWQIIEGFVKFAFASIAILALDFWVAVNVLAMGFVTILVMVLFNKKLTSYIRQNNAFYDRLNRICIDYLFNIVTVKSLRLETISQKYLLDTKPHGYSLLTRIARFQELKWGSVGVGYCLVMGSSLLIYFHDHRGLTGAFDVAQVYVLLNYLERIFQSIGSFTGYFGGVIESATAYEDASRIYDDAKTVQRTAAATEPKVPWSSLQIKDLEFRYLQRERQGGIRAQNLEIKRGDKIALVGPSGGGKSTLLKVLGGMLVPERSEITSEAGTTISIEQISASCLVLPQEPEIFSESVRYNITMGEKFRPEEMHFYLALCKAEEVLSKLPQGWDSDLAEKGLNLSVGEKQRFAMSRGLLRASSRDILLLDEPTSSLDPMTEKQIFYGILHHFTDRTIITACHRLALVPLFDKIVYIRRGQIEEVGSFKELIEKRGPFFQAWDDYEKKVIQDTGT